MDDDEMVFREGFVMFIIILFGEGVIFVLVIVVVVQEKGLFDMVSEECIFDRADSSTFCLPIFEILEFTGNVRYESRVVGFFGQM